MRIKSAQLESLRLGVSLRTRTSALLKPSGRSMRWVRSYSVVPLSFNVAESTV